MPPLQASPDTWIPATWENYLQELQSPAYEKARGYYHQHHMRLEIHPIGFDHSTDHALLALAINLFCILHRIPLTLADNCSFRKAGERDCQPDLACYVGDQATQVPKDTGIVNLDRYPAPNLVIEISKSTLLDDLGTKRTLYEALGVQEYWVVDVQSVQILAYAIQSDGSHRIERSNVLAGLMTATLEEALRQSRQVDQAVVGNWLMQQFQ